jgi:excisionase family DNA binding protein
MAAAGATATDSRESTEARLARAIEFGWPDQREAARQLGLGASGQNSLRLGRESGRIPECYWVRRRHAGMAGAGVRYHYDVDGIKADPERRCVRPGCEALALYPSRRCKKDALWGIKSETATRSAKRAAAVVARLHQQARKRFRAEGLLTAGEVADMLGVHRVAVYRYISEGLEIARIEVVAGDTYYLFRRSAVDAFKVWLEGGDWRRQQHRDPRWRARWYRCRWKSLAWFTKYGLKGEIAAERGKRDGRPFALQPPEISLAVKLRTQDPKTWTWQALADRFNSIREPKAQVSFMAVKRAVDRAQQNAA